MKSKKCDHYLDPYRRAVEALGPGFGATLWSSRQSQVVRFDVMIEMAEWKGREILDAGCGSGDFAGRLIERGVTFGRYVGIDGLEEQISAARQRNLPGCAFELGDFVHDPSILASYPADWITFSGSLNTIDEETARRILAESFRAARRGIVFNFLSDRAPPEQQEIDIHPARRFDTVRMIDWALDQSPRIRFRQDYLNGHDATICIEKLE